MEKQKKKKLQTRRILSLKERIEVIKCAEVQRDTRELARSFDCGRTQILTILQQKERLLREWANNGDPNRLRRRPSPFAVAVNKMVAEWIHRNRCAQIPITDHMILAKAHQAKKFLKYIEFRPNRRWLDRFKRRYRSDDIDLEAINPLYSSGHPIKSLKLSDIFEDIKGSLDLSVIDEKMAAKPPPEDEALLPGVNQSGMDRAESVVDQMEGLRIRTEMNEVDEAIEGNDATTWRLDGIDEEEVCERPVEGIRDNAHALELIKLLEEYSMLRGNYRAIGLIGQLEKLIKGELES